ncbi:MAG: DUF6076 domain-containing protein [Clostridia bacterium]
MKYTKLIIVDDLKKEILNENYMELGFLLRDYIPLNFINEPNYKYKEATEDTRDSKEIINYIMTKANNNIGLWTNYKVIAFKNILYEFYTACLRDKRYYTEKYFSFLMEINLFKIPKSSNMYFEKDYKTEIKNFSYIPNNSLDIQKTLEELSSNYKNLIVANNYELKTEDDIDYYLSVAYHLVKNHYMVRRCEHCNKWFIALVKSDEKYCNRNSHIYPQKKCSEAVKLIKQLARQNNDIEKLHKNTAQILRNKLRFPFSELNQSNAQNLGKFLLESREKIKLIEKGNLLPAEYKNWVNINYPKRNYKKEEKK